MDHIETDKAFDEMTNKPAFWAEVFSEYQSGDVDIKPFLQFLHHRIELEVEKAVKAHAYKIKSILEKENYSNDACIYEIIKDIDSLNK